MAKINELDEMQRAIRDRSQVYGFRLAVLALALWTLYNLLMHFGQGAAYNPLPSLLLCGVLLYQIAWESYLKRSMVEGAEDYREPDVFIRGIFAAIALAVIIVAAGIVVSAGIS